jgi:tRNA (mo5U34)-methyltransferase
MDRDALAREVAAHPGWYHRIELAPGLVTPGTHDSPAGLARLDAIGLPRSCRGLRALDIGCRDGFYAFELERRGAEVVGLDYADPEVTGFSIAARALGSRVRFVVANVYDLDSAEHGHFDLVLFLGVLYHLRNPLLALDRIRAVLSPGGALFVETQLTNEPGAARSRAPLWQFLPGDSLHGDRTNKWAPNAAGLRAAVEECLFRVERATAEGERGYLRAVAVEDRRLAFYRALDSARGWWGRRAAP